ncbi:MAG: hypothetical protein WDN49_07700 [Acetobacteraceae bacterium]
MPSKLRALVGLPCRVTLRDGARPDIVLQPDLRQAHAAFGSVWRGMAAALLPASKSALPLPFASFGFGLEPRDGDADVPYLCWHDGVALAAASPYPAQSVSRIVAAFGQALSAELDIASGFARGFGAACGFLTAGVAPSSEWQEECDLVAASLPGCTHPLQSVALGGASRTAAAGCGDAKTDAFWAGAGPLLLGATALFRSWTAAPSDRRALRMAWRRGMSLALNED